MHSSNPFPEKPWLYACLLVFACTEGSKGTCLHATESEIVVSMYNRVIAANTEHLLL